MNWNGYTGNILNIDLSTQAMLIDKQNYMDIRRFIGGIGINCCLAADLITSNIDPLSPENYIIIGTGPFVGTLMPGASRTVVLSKFPATGAIANSCGSMSFGFHMKHAGYDHIILSGKAEEPSILVIENDDIQIIDGSNLWGNDIVKTTDLLKKKYGESGVIAIGQAGENLVYSSLTLIDKTSTLGRGGLGAIMGSKNLKAILVKGNQGIQIAHQKEFLTLYRKLFKRIKEYPQRESWHELGMLRSLPIGMILAAKGQKSKARQVNERAYLKKFKYRRIACPSCPMGDKDILEIKSGKYSELINYTSSVINPFLMMTLDGMETSEQAIYVFDLINRYGLDSLTITSLLDFLTNMSEQGLLPNNELEITFKKDYNSLIRLIEMITYREGFGDILAQGWNKLKKIFPNVNEKMLTVKGLDVIFEPRFLRLGTMEFEQVVNPKGAHVASGGSPTYVGAGGSKEKFKRHFNRMGIDKSAFNRLFDPPFKKMGINIGRLTRYSEDWYTVLTSLGLCARAQMNRFYSLKLVTQFYNAITGLDFSEEDIIKGAERTWNLLKILNMKEGFTRKNDKFPEEWFNPLKFGNNILEFKNFQGDVKITKNIAHQLLDDYYEERGWSIKDGLPTNKKIKDLELDIYI